MYVLKYSVYYKEYFVVISTTAGNFEAKIITAVRTPILIQIFSSFR